jgi:hypothetical protein
VDVRLKTFFVIVIFLVIATKCGSIDGLEVVEATYGANCTTSPNSVVPGNMTSVIVTDCDHRKGTCTFDFTLEKLKRMGGDPAVGCVKDLSVNYKCNKNGEIRTAKVNGEALYKTLILQCPRKVN